MNEYINANIFENDSGLRRDGFTIFIVNQNRKRPMNYVV